VNYGWVKINSVVPSSGYNSDNQNYFIVNTETNIDATNYPGNSWLSIEIIRGNNTVAYSGYLNIPSNSSGEPQLHEIEFGGGWLDDESGDYKLVAKVFNLVGTEKNSAKSQLYDAFYIDKFDETFLTTYTVEYDQCVSQSVYSYANLGNKGEKVINQAFVQAGVKFDFTGIDGTVSNCERLNYDEASSMINFINDNKNQGRDIYMAGIIGFTSSVIEPPWGVGIQSVGSLIAYTDINEYSASDPLGINHDDCAESGYGCNTREFILQGVIVHEFGHLFSLGDNEEHSSIWCAMYYKTLWLGPFSDPPGRWLMQNPHFCDTHLNNISFGE
ncbi:MAG: hypothetical protein GWP19_12380, partial [Planctomycetia bacterium]|nr:hypothetical protein [Planctomycetia bacterium]